MRYENGRWADARACRTILALVLVLGLAPCAWAHRGSFFPVVINKSVAPYVVSVYQDLHLREILLTVRLEPSPNHTLPEDVRVSVFVRPASGRAAEQEYVARHGPVPDVAEYVAKLPVAKEQRWRSRVTLQSAAGAAELAITVGGVARGPSLGVLLGYAIAFGLTGLLWLSAALRQRARECRSASFSPQSVTEP